MDYVISLDWFQYYCLAPVGLRLEVGTFFQGPMVGPKGKAPVYEVCNPTEFHSIYRRSVLLKCDGYPICHVHWQPKSSALDKHSSAVKCANRLLYSSSWCWFLHNAIAAVGLEIKSITRADLCCDFVKFANDMLPNDFIHHYVRDTASDDTETYIRRGSNKFCVIGKKTMIGEGGTNKITENTCIESVVSQFEYLRFGTRQSGVSVYLYNKSEELRTGHQKPWIVQSWVDKGLISTKDGEPDLSENVYRLELSIQAKGMTVRVKAPGAPTFTDADVVRKLASSDFDCQRSLEETFWAYQARYFHFKVARGQKYRKDMEDLQLFVPELAPTIKPAYLNRATNYGVAERNASRALWRVKNNSFYLTGAQQQTLIEAARILESVHIMKKNARASDLNYALDPGSQWRATEAQQETLRRMIEEKVGDLLSCFRDPVVSQAVIEWEASQEYARDLYLGEIEGKELEEQSARPGWEDPSTPPERPAGRRKLTPQQWKFKNKPTTKN